MMPLEPFSLAMTNRGKAMYALCEVQEGVSVEWNGRTYAVNDSGWLCVPYTEDLPRHLLNGVIIQEKELLRIDGGELWIAR